MRRKKLTGRSVTSMLGAASVAFLVVVAGGCGGEEGTSSQAGESAEQEAPEQTQTEPVQEAEEATATIGDVVTVGDVQWSVIDAEELDQLISDKGENEPGNFVVVDVALRNNTNQDLTVATPFLTLLDDQGREFEGDIDTNFTFLYPEENVFVDQARPGSVKEGKAIFAVEPNSSGFELQVNEARFAAGETATIDLGI